MSLFRAEFARLFAIVALLALAHLGGLIFLSRMVDLGQQNLSVHWSFGAVYGLCGALLGIVQFVIYARPNPWLGLIHRPLAPRLIATSLLGAGALLLALLVALPILLTVLWQQGMTARVVDLRHYLLALAGWQIAMVAYFGGVFAALAPKRYAAIGLVALFWLISANATGPAALLVQAVALLWTLWIVAAVFKANRDTPPRTVNLVAVALPLSMGLYFIAIVAFAAVELVWIAWGTHPNNGVPPVGGHNEMEKTTASERMLAALKASNHADAVLLAEQVKLSAPVSIGSGLARLPQWQELTNVTPMEFDDERRGVRFVFSHDDARLHGYRIRDGAKDVTLDLAFLDPPLPFGRLPGMHDGDQVMVARGRVYHYESETQKTTLRIALPHNEPLLSIAPVGEALAALSDRAIYIFDVRPFIATRGVVAPRARLPLQGPYGPLGNLDLIELVDGHLVVATYGFGTNHPNATAPFQTAEILRSDGTVEFIGRRALRFDFGWLYRYQAQWLSPALYLLREQAKSLFAEDNILAATTPEPSARAPMVLAALLMLFAPFLAWYWLRHRRVDHRWAWTGACALFGLPMFGALVLIEHSAERSR